jgi:DNA primase
MRAAIAKAVPFVRFRVERVLAAGDESSPEGRDRILEELRPVFATLPPSAMRMELTRMLSSRLAVTDAVVEEMLAGARRESPRAAVPESRAGSAPQREARARSGPVSRRGDTERAFLALCIAAPEEGAVALAGLDVEEDFSSDLLRRAARHLRAGELAAPMAERPGETPALEDDPELKGLLAELIVEAGREASDPAMLEVQRLQLELARLERGIQQARGQEDKDVSGLARQKAALKVEFDRAYSRVLEKTGEQRV